MALPSLAYKAQPPNRPPWAMITPSAPAAGTATSAVTEKDLFLMLTTLFSERRPIPGKNIWEVPRIRVGRPATSRDQPFCAAVVDGQHLVLGRLDQPEPLQLRQPARAAPRPGCGPG